MDSILIKLTNCHGINKFSHEFHFNQKGTKNTNISLNLAKSFGIDYNLNYDLDFFFFDKISEESNRIIQLPQADERNNVSIEVLPLDNFYLAEEYHQDYLIKNPTGYCHVNLKLIKKDERK